MLGLLKSNKWQQQSALERVEGEDCGRWSNEIAERENLDYDGERR